MTIKTDTDYHNAVHGLLKFISDSSHPYTLPLTGADQATFIAAILHQAGEILDNDQFARGEIIRSMQKQKELDFEDLDQTIADQERELIESEEFVESLMCEMDLYEEIEERTANLKPKDTKGAAKILKELRERHEHRMSSRAANEEGDNCDRGGDCCREILE